MKIIIYSMKKEPNIIFTDDDEKIINVMMKLKDISGININKIRLLYNGIYLNPNNKISDYNIKNNDIMYVTKILLN